MKASDMCPHSRIARKCPLCLREARAELRGLWALEHIANFPCRHAMPIRNCWVCRPPAEDEFIRDNGWSHIDDIPVTG